MQLLFAPTSFRSPLPVLRERVRVRVILTSKGRANSNSPSPQPSPGLPGEGARAITRQTHNHGSFSGTVVGCVVSVKYGCSTFPASWPLGCSLMFTVGVTDNPRN